MRVNWAEDPGIKKLFLCSLVCQEKAFGNSLLEWFINGNVLAVNHQPPSTVIESAHRGHVLPFHDTRDFDNADRGFITALSPCVIKAADGRVVWDNDSYSFLNGPAPTSVHPSLWRQSTLAAKQGLYEVVPGIYQVRGLDLSNVTFVETDTGIIVIDPLVSTEVAAAALALYRS
jgi:alkyl sulfatase BDS1-like metallo-beta-lactamase superfamily hydrolase